MSDILNYKGDDCHIGYKNLFQDDDSDNSGHKTKIRSHVAELWDKFSPFADKNFKDEFRRELDQRYWEMYLGCCLLDRGFEITTAGKGPDFSIFAGEKIVWIEAVAPKAGHEGNTDLVPKLVSGIQALPKNKMILRYRTAIDAKVKKFRDYIQSGLVQKNDATVIAVSNGGLDRRDRDTNPFILSAVFPIGDLFINIDRETSKVVQQGYYYKPNVTKANSSEVDTLFFLNPEYGDISAIIYSASDIGNPPQPRGADIFVIYNPHAKNPIPKGSLKFSNEYWAELKGDIWEIKNSSA